MSATTAADGQISQPHWTPAKDEDLVDGARVGYRGSYGLTSMREGVIEGGMTREAGDLPSWTVRLDSDGCTRWGYLGQFYVLEKEDSDDRS